MVGLLLLAGDATQTADLSTRQTQPGPYGRLPLMFEANHGQADNRVQFLARGSGYQLFLTRAEAVMAFTSPATEPRASAGVPMKMREAQSVGDVKQAAVRMTLEGANPDPHAVGLEQLRSKVNYLRGNDPDEWQTNVPTYAKVRYESVYPGIDLVYYGHERQLEYDFIVAPGGDPDSITLSFEGADGVDLDAAGDVVLTTMAGPVRFQKPVVYQERDGRRQSVAGDYVRKDSHRIGFRVAEYDTTRSLIIDPVVSYATYLGGRGEDRETDIAVDGNGAAYVTGETTSPNFPTLSPIRPAMGGFDAFVAKLSPDGTALVYLTYLGGSSYDSGTGIAVDATGSAVVVGHTSSSDFPFQYGSGPNPFVARLTPDGTGLVYVTPLGAADVAVDAAGSAYLVGGISAPDLPTKSPLQPTLNGGSDAFVIKLAADGALVYGTYLGGSNNDHARGVAVDAAGAAYVTGFTVSTDFPTTTPFQPELNGGADAFVAKLTPDGTALIYATYLGGSGTDFGMSIAVDGADAAHITGRTDSSDFPTQSLLGAWPSGDSFIAKVTPDGSALAFATYLTADATDIAVDAAGATYITGYYSRFSHFFVVHPILPVASELGTAFVLKLAPEATALVYSVTFATGSACCRGSRIAADSIGRAYVTGTSYSWNVPPTNAVQPTPEGGPSDAFVMRLAPADTDVPVRNVNALLEMPEGEVSTSFDPTPVSPTYPVGTFSIVASFDNVSSFDICNPFFQVVEMGPPFYVPSNLLQGVWIEPTGQQIQGPQAYPVDHPTTVFASASRMRFRFEISLRTADPFRFFVNVWGTPQAPGTPCP
jgi:hypothetical protein